MASNSESRRSSPEKELFLFSKVRIKVIINALTDDDTPVDTLTYWTYTKPAKTYGKAVSIATQVTEAIERSLGTYTEGIDSSRSIDDSPVIR
jgi:hypothetical protein